MSENLGFIHRFVAGQRPLTLLLLHGTGGTEEDLLGVGDAIAPGANLLSPRGKSLDEGMPRFFRRFTEGQFDEQDIIFRARELADFIAAAANHYKFDSDQLIALGYSNGANIAAAVMLLHPQTLGGGMLLRAMVPLEPKSPPDLSGKSVLMCEAQNDPIVPVENAQRLAGFFRAAGADVSLKWMTSGHGLSQDDFQACADWISQRASSPPARRA
jgi:predicted esterase